jgi:hypothetical protein
MKNATPAAVAAQFKEQLGAAEAREIVHGLVVRARGAKKAHWVAVLDAIDGPKPPPGGGALKVGMVVYFGRPNGAKTRGVILSIKKRVAIRQTETRGGKPIGTVWHVAPALVLVPTRPGNTPPAGGVVSSPIWNPKALRPMGAAHVKAPAAPPARRSPQGAPSKLVTDLKDATAAGLRAAKGKEVGGFNFDKLLIQPKSGSELARALPIAGLTGHKVTSGIYKGWWAVDSPGGLGGRSLRTLFAEAASKFLRGRGYETSVWYKAD